MMKHNESGFTLVGVLAVFSILSVFGISLVMLSISSVKTSNNEHDDQSVFYIAEAGANYMVNEIEIMANDVYRDDNVSTSEEFYQNLSIKIDTLEGNSPDFEVTEKGIKPKASIKLEKTSDSSPAEYTITSTGTIDKQSRVVEQTITINWEEKYEQGGSHTPTELPPFAVFVSGGKKESYDLQDGAVIEGDIGISSNRKGGIGLQGDAKITGNIYVPNGDEKVVENVTSNKVTIEKLDEKYTMPDLPTFPEFPKNLTKLPDEKYIKNESETTDLIKNNKLFITSYLTNNYTLEMHESLEFKEIQINSNRNLYIDTGNSDKNIVVDRLALESGHIILKGTGKLTIYVRDELEMEDSSSINNDGDVNQVNIFYKNNSTLKLQGDQKIYGSIFAKDANIDLQNSGTIHGNIFTGGKEVKLQGAGEVKTQLIFAPNAKVEIQNGGMVKGMIISERFEMEGGGKVIFKEPFVIDGPISPSALGHKDSENGDSGDEAIDNETGASPTFSHSPIREVQ